ncbi:MAG: biotin/lipoyl-containing protein, partial [Candidatus Nanopelagicales bacterium]|nr:biotin/lipoyl-containing protein [Candidatus Nanopelagicales bacterium]
ESAVREAVVAFGRGECFVERFLDKPRHVETQVLADNHGNVVVVSTRDCSLQRRNQKLVEEAPAPFLTPEQHDRIYDASKAIIREAGYVGAGTCEFLIGTDGTVSFLEVNTRLQVEHPVTEEVSGIDLVREQLRIAAGEALGYSDPELRGHSIEFRINGEDPGRNFLPAPGKLTRWEPPSGPGVRVDAGFRAGDVIGGNFDSLLAKLIITGSTRREALERARRALSEFKIEGIATVLPFARAVVNDPDFFPDDQHEPFRVHTRWIETEFDNTIEPYAQLAEADEPAERTTLTVEVDGRRLAVSLPASLAVSQTNGSTRRATATRRRKGGKSGSGASGDALTSPMQGTVVKVAVEEGQRVEAGELVVVLEAMKMEQPLNAHKAGIITSLAAEPGVTVPTGTVLCEIKE